MHHAVLQSTSRSRYQGIIGVCCVFVVARTVFGLWGDVSIADAQELADDGSITVCKVIADQTGNIADGHELAGSEFSISGVTPGQPVEDPPVGQIGTSNFISPLSFNIDLFGSDGHLDAECITYGDLPLGSYYYGEEISPGGQWLTPKYNDQIASGSNFTLGNFYEYDPRLFDGDPIRDINLFVVYLYGNFLSRCLKAELGHDDHFVQLARN